MTLLSRCRTVAVAALAAGMIVAASAGAGVLQTEPLSRAPTVDAGWQALRVEAPQGIAQEVACDDCAPGTMPFGMAAAEAPPRSATLSVNVAILLLGSLWLTLMVRRVQMRLGNEGLSAGARPHAAGGH